MTPAQEVSRKAKAVAAARALLSLEVGIYIGARRVQNALEYLGTSAEQFPAFQRFLAAVPLALPVGQTRLACSKKLLLESDATLAALESQFRVALFEECLAVITALEPAIQSVTSSAPATEDKHA